MDIHNTASYYQETSEKKKKLKYINVQAHLFVYRFIFYVAKNYENLQIHTVAHTIYAQSPVLRTYHLVCFGENALIQTKTMMM